MRERTDIPTSYSAGTGIGRSRHPWVQDCGSGTAPQFGGDIQDFTRRTIPAGTPYLSVFKKSVRKLFTQWVPLDKRIVSRLGKNCGDVRHSFGI